MAYINKELDELEREDFTRLKKVQEKKAEKIAAEDAERKAHGVKKSSTNTDLMCVLKNPSLQVRFPSSQRSALAPALSQVWL